MNLFNEGKSVDPAPAEPSRGAGPPLKIVVAATPKTGNNWVKYLLAEIYGLSQVALQPNYRVDDWSLFGERWIGHQHYLPEAGLVERAQNCGVRFVTVLRHPADVLVSLRHFMDRTGAPGVTDWHLPESMRLDGPGAYGMHTRLYVEHGFYLALHTSICWLHVDGTLAVRYEDLIARPFETLRDLTDRIQPVPEEKLRAAIASCDIDRMRAAHGATLFRRGGAGGWRLELPREIRHCLATWRPYPAQFAALGYTMLPQEDAVARDTESVERFNDGTPISPFLREAYVKTGDLRPAGWPDLASTGPGSFYAWLNAPAAADPWRGRAFPVITELAHYTYTVRKDVRREYTDPFGRHRMDFANWFVYFGARFCGYDDFFTLPVMRSAANAIAQGKRSCLLSGGAR